MNRLSGKVAIITGSTMGIGKATAVRFAQEGASVVINGRARQRLDETVVDLKGLGGKVLAVQGDVSRSKDVQRMVKETLDTFGRIDILVNNAGSGDSDLSTPRGKSQVKALPLEEIPDGYWDESMVVNLKSMFLTCKAVIPHMKKQRSGKIVNISSRAARIGSARATGAYSVAKAGVLGLTKQLCRELAPYGINCNAIAPGMIMTKTLAETMGAVSEEQRKQAIAGILMGRVGGPEELASVVAFLASDDASYVNGVTIDVNGGSYLAP